MAEKDAGKKVAVAAGAGSLIGAALAFLATRKAEAAPPAGECQLDEGTMNLLIAIAQTTDELLPQIAILAEEAMPKNIREIRIQQNVLQNQGVILNQPPPFDGYIKEVKIHWPPGCNGLVDVRVGHGPVQFCPFEGFLSLDNVTPTYPFDEYIVHTENIWVEIQNTDGLFPHTISVMINIEEKV